MGKLRETLRDAALADPRRRFHQLFDKLYRPDVLQLAFERTCQAGGRPPDYDRAALALEGERLAGGTFRPRGTFGDRVVSQAAALVLEPVLMPRWRFDAWDKLNVMRDVLERSKGPVTALMVQPDWIRSPEGVGDLLAGRIADRRLLALVRAFLAAGLDPVVLDFGSLRVPRLGGGLGSLLCEYQLAALEPRLGPAARAGNEVVLPGGGSPDRWRDVLSALGLTAVELRAVDPVRDGCDFLGFHWRSRFGVLDFWPARSSAQALRDHVREISRGRTHLSLRAMTARLNDPLGEWGAYYRICPGRSLMRKLDHYVRERLAAWNAKKHGRSGIGLGCGEVSRSALAELGLIELGRLPRVRPEGSG